MKDAEMRKAAEKFERAMAEADKPRCEYGARLCEIRVAPGPSGMRLRHSHDCPDKPGEPIPATEYARGRQWPPVGRIGR